MLLLIFFFFVFFCLPLLFRLILPTSSSFSSSSSYLFFFVRSYLSSFTPFTKSMAPPSDIRLYPRPTPFIISLLSLNSPFPISFPFQLPPPFKHHEHLTTLLPNPPFPPFFIPLPPHPPLFPLLPPTLPLPPR